MSGAARIAARASVGEGLLGASEELEDAFPGRWDARRAFHPDLRPLVAAAAAALARAGWWTPGSGAAVPGGLVVAVDLHGFGPGLRFAPALEAPRRPVRPSDFLHSLPSTPAATLGLLFGLTGYQATVGSHGLAGAQALRHAVDRLTLGRLERVVVAALTVAAPAAARRLGLDLAAPFALAGAWCLEPDPAPGDEAVAAADPAGPDALAAEELVGDLPAPVRGLAGPTLLALERALAQGAEERVVVARDRLLGGAEALRVRGRA